MKLKFWERDTTPAPSGECAHLWSDWSTPVAIAVTSFSMLGAGSEREGWMQDRHITPRANMEQYDT